MTILIPGKGQKAEWIRPFDVDGNTSRYLAPVSQPVNPAQPLTSSLAIANINPREYIQLGINGIHGTSAVISAYELQGSNSKNYEDTHRFVLEKGLYMPDPRIFTTYFKNVIEAKKGNRTLNYADGTQVLNSEVEEIFKHLTTNHKAVFGSQPGAWTWLNAGFNNGNIETVTGMDANKGLIKNIVQLEACLNEDCYINLDFNSQGLAKSKHQEQSYKQGENIYFYFPRNGAVAGFGASSDRANLSCYGDASDTDPALGVFACAEGAV
jgi:hypothetical protein